MPLTLMVLCSGVATAEEVEFRHECHGRTVAILEVHGCKKLWCSDAKAKEKLLRVAELQRGDTYTDAAAHQSQLLLDETGYFKAVEIHCFPISTTSSAQVHIRLHPHRWIRRVTVEGNSALFKSDIKKRLLIRTGMPFNPDSEEGRNLRRRQQEAIKRLYQKEGFDNAAVQITATPSSADGLDVLVSVIEGRKSKLASIRTRIVRRPVQKTDAPFGTNIQCPKITRRQLRLASRLSVGDVITTKKLRESRRRIRNYLRRQGFIEPKIELQHSEKLNTIEITTTFDRCFVLRFKVRDDPSPGLSGYGEIDPEPFINELTYASSGNFDVREAEENRALLELWYQSQGYLFSSVSVDHRVVQNKNYRLPGVHGLITFYITRNYVNEIRAISFEGNTVFEDNFLEERMRTKSYDFFTDGGYLLVEQLFGDLVRLRLAYKDKGYFGMRFAGAPKGSKRKKIIRVNRIVTKGRIIFEYTYDDLLFRVRKHPQENVIYIEVPIEENDFSKTGEIQFTGWSDVAELRTKLKLQPGSNYAYPTVAKDRAFIQQYFQRLGHYRIAVETKCSTEDEGPDVCDWEKVKAPLVDLHHHITAGPKFIIGETFVRGNYNTKTQLILDELPPKGAPLDKVRLEEAERRLRSMGVFSGVRINTIGTNKNALKSKVALVVIVQERRAQFLDVSAGFESLTVRDSSKGLPVELTSSLSSSVGAMDSVVRGTGSTQPINIPDLLLFTEVKYRHRNFLGRAMELQFPIKYGFSTGFTADDMHRLGHLSTTIFDPYLFGTDYALETTIFGRYDRATKEEDEYEFGGQIALSKTYLKRLNTRLQYTISGIQTGDFLKDVEPNEDLPFTPLRPKMELEIQSSLDFLDNPANPTRGFAIGASLAYINITKGDGSQESATEVFGNFLRWEANIRVFLNLRRKLILAVLMRYGDSYSINEDNLPQVKRFRLGGIWGVRGFEDDSISPTTKSGEPNPGELPGGDSLLTGTLELRFPILSRINLWGGLFFDVGALAESTTDFHARSFRTSAGAGLRYLLLGQVPLRLDVAVNLDRQCIKDEVALGNECNLEPLAVPQFSLLYTF